MYRIAVPLPPVEWGQKASPLGVRSHALGRKLSAKQTDEVPLRWLRAFIVAEARGVAFGRTSSVTASPCHLPHRGKAVGDENPRAEARGWVGHSAGLNGLGFFRED